MTTDLSVCQAALARDPVLYLDLTEAVRRRDGRVLGACPTGALVAFTDPADGTDFGFTMFADDRETAQRLLLLLPPVPGFITVHENHYFDLLEKRFALTGMQACWQFGCLSVNPLPLPETELEIRPLDPSHLPVVLDNYHMEDRDYLARLIGQGALYGAFDGSALTGFAGCHSEGSMGLLEVLPQYRRQGIASLLQTFMIDLELSRQHIPYGQVFDGNEPSMALQRSLGMTCSMGRLYWAVRSDQLFPDKEF